MTISKEAIEAAANKVHEVICGCTCLEDATACPNFGWPYMEEAATAALTAAAPYIQAAELRDAALDFPTELREFAWTDPATGLIDYISVQDWLDARADQLEGKTE